MTADEELEEIAFDDSEDYFQEDFGTPLNDQAQTVVDPLDDIADVNKIEGVVYPDVEYLETKDPPILELHEDDAPAIELFEDEKFEDVSNMEDVPTTTITPEDFERVFDHT